MAVSRDPGRRNPLTHMLEEAFDALMRQAMFCLPGRVVAFDPATQLARVECGIQRVIDGRGATIPVIEQVPVCFPGDNGFHLFHQITDGQTEGLIHFSQRAIDTWLEQGGPVAPHETRVLSEEDAFFVPGVRSKPGAISAFKNDGVGLSNDSGSHYVHVRADGVTEVNAPGNVEVVSGGDVTVTATGNADVAAAAATVVAATNVDVEAPTINLTGVVNITGALNLTGPLAAVAGGAGGGGTLEGTFEVTGGDVIADGISLKGHTHPGGSGGTTGAPQ